MMYVMHFGLFLGEDTQESGNHVENISLNESMPLNYPEESNNSTTSSPSLGGMVPSLALPPPPPAVFLGYSLPPGHPCNSFTLPPPPADKKRTGPRRKFYIFLVTLYIFSLYFWWKSFEISTQQSTFCHKFNWH